METLYRKYRPQNFSDIEGQEHVVQTLHGALMSGTPGHAYLFAGPRGTGKTTLARLFAKALNCPNRNRETNEPCNSCPSCSDIASGVSLDLIEIDAASNRGIDEIRALRDSANVSSHAASYKAFIIDEVHMLTTPAFNALLKTLEEPPHNVVFILATTEVHKVPETILSRVQRFDFKKISHEQISAKLDRIIKKEKVVIEPEALQLVATLAGGSLRDAESTLTKLITYHGKEKITAQSTAHVLGIVSQEVHKQFWQIINDRNRSAGLKLMSDIVEQGYSIDQFSQQFLHFLRSQLITSQENANTNRLIETIRAMTTARLSMRYSPIPQLPFELAVIELTKDNVV